MRSDDRNALAGLSGRAVRKTRASRVRAAAARRAPLRGCRRASLPDRRRPTARRAPLRTIVGVMGFAMKVSLARDPRYAATARLIVEESAREAGCNGAPAEAFAGRVEDAARSCLAESPSNPHVMMAVEREPEAVGARIAHPVRRLALKHRAAPGLPAPRGPPPLAVD